MINPHKISRNVLRVEVSMIERMKEMQATPATKFDLFRSMLLAHYCGHFYKEIAWGHFTDTNCKLCVEVQDHPP